MLGTSQALVALYDRTFLLGQSFMLAICHLLLGILLFQISASTAASDP